MITEYIKGLHILGEITSVETEFLTDDIMFKTIIDKAIFDESLNKLGEVYHSFDNKGFTAAICLTESHIATHTWPEYNRLTFDVFLSNYQNNNDDKTRKIVDIIIKHFKSDSYSTVEITR